MLHQSVPDTHADLRDAVRDLCHTFPPEYWRKIDEARGYPEHDYVTVQAGVLAATVMVIVVNLCVDLLYSVIDPRIAR